MFFFNIIRIWTTNGPYDQATKLKTNVWQLWDLNPRPFGPEPKSGALDHSAKLSCWK